MKLIFNVSGNLLELTNESQIVSGESNVTECEFVFDSAWDGFARTVLFQSTASNLTPIILENGVTTCNIPPEITLNKKVIYIGVCGIKGGSVLNTNWKTVKMVSGANPNFIPIPTDSIYAQITGIMQKQAVDAQTAQQANTQAAGSASAASSSASAALTSANNAFNSATAAATSASTASTKSSEAATSATNAANSATNASTSANTASTKASEASTSATNAANSATAAATSASTASTKASEASTSATNAATSATNAVTTAAEAITARTSTVKNKTFSSLDDRIEAIEADVDVANIDIQIGTTIQSTVADDYIAELKIEGATTITPTNAGLDISPDNVATIVSASNFDVTAMGSNVVTSVSYRSAPQYNDCVFFQGIILPSTTYTISLVIPSGESYYVNTGLFTPSTTVIGDGTRKSITLTTVSLLDKNVNQYNATYGWRLFKNSLTTNTSGNANSLQIELGLVANQYEPYKSNKLTITQELRKLPNGVCDTIEKDVDGKWYYVQRIGKVVFNGSENYWAIDIVQTNTIAFKASISSVPADITTVMSDKFKSSSGDVERASAGYGAIYIRIDKARLTTQDLNGFKAWLTTNPVTVYYQLLVPIKTLIPDVKLSTYKGITNIFSTASPQVNITATVKSRLANSYSVMDAKKANATQETIITPTLTNSWVTNSTKLGYYKNTIGKVEFVGSIKSGVLGQSAFTLPVGYRPPQQIKRACVSNDAFGYLVIDTDGTVKPYGSNAFIEIGAISFRVDA